MARRKNRQAAPVEAPRAVNRNMSPLDRELARIEEQKLKSIAERKAEEKAKGFLEKTGEFFTGKVERPEWHSNVGPEEQASKNLIFRYLTPELIEQYQRDINQSRLPLGEQVLGAQGNQMLGSLLPALLQQHLKGPSEFPEYGGNEFNDLLPAILGSLLVPHAQKYFGGNPKSLQEYNPDTPQYMPPQEEEYKPDYRPMLPKSHKDPQLNMALQGLHAQDYPIGDQQYNILKERINTQNRRQNGKRFRLINGRWQ
jgi:hypothetical protein